MVLQISELATLMSNTLTHSTSLSVSNEAIISRRKKAGGRAFMNHSQFLFKI